MPQPLNFGERTFLEILSRAAREKVYSAALAWALDDRSGLPLDWRLTIVAALSTADTTGSTSIKATTEWNRVDVLLTVKGVAEDQYVAIENKITAMQGEQQLAAYDDLLKKERPGTVKKVLLTLTGEEQHSGEGWKPVSYSVLYNALCAEPVPENQYISDLCSALARLVAARNAVYDSPEVAAFVFEKRKPLNEMEDYIKDMRLKVVMQRIWFVELAKKLKLNIPKPWQVVINEERGSACLDVKAELKDEPGYAVGMQLQNRSLKAYCYPHPYQKARPDQNLVVEKILRKMKTELDPNNKQKLSSTRSKGFRSFSFPDVSIRCDRILDDWLKIIAPQLERLFKTVPSVKPLTISALPVVDSQ